MHDKDAGRLLTLLQGFEKVVWGFTVRGCWRLNINCNILTPTVMTVTLCLSCSLGLLNRRPRTHSSRPKGPFGLVWLSLPHSSPLELELSGRNSTATGSSNSTELYNRSTPTRSLKSNV